MNLPFEIAWATDIHLDLCSPAQRDAWVSEVMALGCETLVLTGDLSNNEKLVEDLERLRHDLAPMVVRFVLGNHDFWDAKCRENLVPDEVRDMVRGQVAALSRLQYVHDVDAHDPQAELGPLVCLGVDGWWDGRGLQAKPDPSFQHAFYRMRARADHDTHRLSARIDAAVRQGRVEFLILTHVPPFLEAAKYSGPNPKQAYLFANMGLGTMLAIKANAYPQANFTVLCGHTHELVDYPRAVNLRVLVGSAAYGTPQVRRLRFDSSLRAWA